MRLIEPDYVSKLFFMTLGTALLLIGLVVLPVYPQKRHSVRRTTQSREQARLVKEIRHELITLPNYNVFDWLEFQTDSDGFVTLRGQVTRPTLKSAAERSIRGIQGVSKVNNQIEILPLSPNDDRIRRAVYTKLFNFDSPIYRYGLGAVPSIHIIVNNGNVTLKGIVDNENDKNYAAIQANSTSGVFSVKSELTMSRDNFEAAVR